MKPLHLASLAALSIGLAACGDGGGSSIASAPAPLPPPRIVSTERTQQAPLDSNPAWTSGTYTAIAKHTGPGPAVGTLQLTVDSAARTYALTIALGTIAVDAMPLAYGSDLGTKWKDVNVYSNGDRVTLQNWSSVTGTYLHGEVQPDSDTRIGVDLQTYAGWPDSSTGSSQQLRHTALGGWSLERTKLAADGTFKSTGSANDSSWGYFAFGDRTAPGDLPVSGTASYEIVADYGEHSGCEYACPSLAATTDLSVDFGASSISATYSLAEDFQFNENNSGGTNAPSGTYMVRTNATGSSPIGNAGDFDIPLSGTGSVLTSRIDNTPVAPINVPVTGSITGAFFGPQGAELGGVYSIPQTDTVGGVYNWSGAFGAVRSGP
jgi:C-lobe and N-lobe beta barrels of Tf-binding protein B